MVVAIIAIASAGVSFALRDSQATQLEREAQRLAALLESAPRAVAQQRRAGALVPPRRAASISTGCRPTRCRSAGWRRPPRCAARATLQLGPEPIIGKQAVVLGSTAAPNRSLRIATDGLRPFAVTAGETP